MILVMINICYFGICGVAVVGDRKCQKPRPNMPPQESSTHTNLIRLAQQGHVCNFMFSLSSPVRDAGQFESFHESLFCCHTSIWHQQRRSIDILSDGSPH